MSDRLKLDSDCLACRYDAYFIEQRKVQESIDGIAEFGGTTVGLRERLIALEENPPPENVGQHTCGRRL